MKTATVIVALFALVGFASAQVCTPVATCSATLSAVPVPSPWYSLNFSVDPRPTNAVYGWSTSGVNETGCASAAFHQGVLQFVGATQDSAILGPSVNLTAPSTQPNGISTPLPTTVLFGVGTSQGNVQQATAGWSIELTFKALAITNWAKIFDFGADGVGVPGGAGGHYDTLFGWQGTSNVMVWTTNGPNGGTGNSPDISPLSSVVFGQWYTVALVYQETAAGLANYFSYVNGVLIATQTNVYFPPAVARASANLARSSWNDAYWVGELDTFNIYRYALTSTQAAALAARAQGGCAIAQLSSTNATTTPPAPFFDVSFSVDPRTAAGGSSAANFGWLPADADDASCGLNLQHTGLLQLNGQYAANNPTGNYVNLSAASGPQSVGTTVLPVIGGASAGSGDSAGWSFEITFKAEVAYKYAKIFDIAAPQNLSRSNPCQYDIILGFLETTGRQPAMQFDVCSVGVEFQFNNWATIQLGTWYHIVISVQQLPLQPTQAIYTSYVNGVRAGVSGVSYYPEAVARGNGNLAKSSWADNYFGGLIDNFRIYNQALTGPQVNTLYVSAMGAVGIQRCPQVASSALPTNVTADAISFSLNFNSDPRAAGGASNAVYTWLSSDANDTAADRSVHQGLVLLGGFPNTTLGAGVGPYVNLSSPSGPTSVGQVMPLIGTNVNGLWSQGSVGFSLELVVKMRAQNSWGKVFDLAAARATPGGTCNGDLVLGWEGDSTILSFESCLDDGTSSGRMQLPNTTTLNQWLHIVIVVQQNYTNTAIAVGYVNGVRVASLALSMPYAQYRRDAALGRSNWNDQYINAVYDLFNVYNIALNPAQVATQFAASRVSQVVAPAGSSSSAVSSVSAGSSSSSSASAASASIASFSSSSSSSVTTAASSGAGGGGGGGGIGVNSTSSSSSSSAAGLIARSSSSSSSSSSAVSTVVARSSSSSSSSTGAAVVVLASSSSSSSSSAAVAVTASSSSGASPFVTSDSSSPASVSVDSSSSSVAVEEPSSSSTGVAGPPPTQANGATSAVASVVVLAVCAMASLALTL